MDGYVPFVSLQQYRRDGNLGRVPHHDGLTEV